MHGVIHGLADGAILKPGFCCQAEIVDDDVAASVNKLSNPLGKLGLPRPQEVFRSYGKAAVPAGCEDQFGARGNRVHQLRHRPAFIIFA